MHQALRSPGQPLDHATRAYFEPRFGHDFSQVRVHTDDRAAASARAVNARAYAVGREIVFAAGRRKRACTGADKSDEGTMLQPDGGTTHAGEPDQHTRVSGEGEECQQKKLALPRNTVGSPAKELKAS